VTSPDAAVYLRMEDSFGRVVQISDNSTAATVGDRRPHSVELPDSNDYDYKLLFENFTTPVGWFPYRRTYDTYDYPTTYSMEVVARPKWADLCINRHRRCKW
jgi:hypothetical protein